jgi:hypothetical protein
VIAKKLGNSGQGSFQGRLAHYLCEEAESLDVAEHANTMVTLLKQATEAAPHNARARIALAKTYEQTNRSPEAFKELDSVTKEQQAAPKVVPNAAPNAAPNPAPQAEPVQSSRPAPARAAEAAQARTPSQPAAIVEPIPLERIEAPLSPASTGQAIPPATKRDGSLLESVRAVGSDTVVVQGADGTERQLGLLGANNPEYVARRSAALQKPGAVIGQVTVE